MVPGWNLVVYASFRPEARDVSLAGVPGVTQVEGLGDPSDPYGLRAVASTEILAPAGPYWVYVSGAGGPWMQA